MVQQISQLRAEAELAGADSYVAKATAMSRATGDLGSAVEALGATTETADVKVVNATGAFERYRLRVDAAARAERDLDRVKRAGQAALEQGRATQEQVNETLSVYERRLAAAQAQAQRSYGVARAETREAADMARRHVEELDRTEAAMGRVEGAGRLVMRTLAGLGIVLSAREIFNMFSAAEDRILASERGVARLNAQLAVTGGAAGKSLADIRRLAEEMEATTGIASQTIMDRAAALLTFTTIADEQFDRTMRVAADMAEVYDQDLKSALEAVGRAVENPLKGMGMLEKQGFRLEAAQKAQIKTLIEQEKQYEAQEIVLRMLEDLVGGASVAAYQGLEKAQDGATRSGQRMLERLYEMSGAGEASLAVWTAMGESFDWLTNNMAALGDAAQFLGTALAATFGLRLAAAIAANVAQIVALEMALGATTVRAALFGVAMKGAQVAAAGFGGVLAALGGPVGAALTVAGLGAAAWLTYGRAVDTSSEAVERSRRAMDEINTALDTGNIRSADAAFFKLREAEASEALTKSLIREAQARLAAIQAQMDSPLGGLAFGGAGPAAIAELEDRLIELQGEGEAASATIAALRKVLEDFKAGATGAGTAAASLTDEQVKLAKSAADNLAQIEAETEGLLRIAAAHRVSAQAVAEETVAQEAHAAALKNRMVDEAKLREALMKRVAAQQAAAAAQQLANDRQATELAQARAIAAQIADPSARHAAALAIERQEYLNRLQHLYSQELERIPELMNEWDRKKAYDEQARFWSDVRTLAQDKSRDISQFLVDGLVNAGEGGKSMFRNMWDTALAGGKRFLANFAVEVLKQKLILPIVTAFVGQNSSLMGIIQPGGATGSVAGLGNSASIFGGLGDLAGSAWSGVTGLFGGGAAAGSAASSSAASLAAWTGGANSMAAGAGATGGITAALSAIPVWGWIMAAASTVKGFVEGSDPRSLKGGISTLIGPSLEEWQAAPRRSAANAMDPLGTMLTDFGLPSFLTIGGIASKIFGVDKAPSNKYAQTNIDTLAGTITGPMFNPSEYSQGTVDASQQTAQAYLDLTKMIAELTGGTGPAGAYVHAGERVPYQVNVGGAGLDFHSAGRMSFQTAEEALNWMVQQFVKGLSGVTDENFRKAIAYGGTGEEILANLQFVAALNDMLDDGSMALVRALKTVNEQFDAMAEQAEKLGIATGDLERLREKEIAATRASYEAGIADLQSRIDSTAQQYFAQTLDPLTQFRDSVLRQGALSGMSSRDQYLYAQSQFRGIDDTTSAADAVSISQTYLQQARAYGASGSTFADAFREVNSVVSDLIAQREEEKQGFAALGVVFQTSHADQTKALVEKLNELIDEVSRMRKAQDKAA